MISAPVGYYDSIEYPVDSNTVVTLVALIFLT